MTDQDKGSKQTEGQSGTTSTGQQGQAGDPGRTPDTAEGDEQTVDESLRQKENK